MVSKLHTNLLYFILEDAQNEKGQDNFNDDFFSGFFGCLCVCGSIVLKILLGTNTENRNADTFNVHHDMRMQYIGLVKCQGLSKIGHKNCVNVFQAKQQLFFLTIFFFYARDLDTERGKRKSKRCLL